MSYFAQKAASNTYTSNTCEYNSSFLQSGHYKITSHGSINVYGVVRAKFSLIQARIMIGMAYSFPGEIPPGSVHSKAIYGQRILRVALSVCITQSRQSGYAALTPSKQNQSAVQIPGESTIRSARYGVSLAYMKFAFSFRQLQLSNALG